MLRSVVLFVSKMIMIIVVIVVVTVTVILIYGVFVMCRIYVVYFTIGVVFVGYILGGN